MNANETTIYTTEEISTARRIATAMARDVNAEDMSREWTGLDPQDADQVPAGMDLDRIEALTQRMYAEIVTP